MENFDAPCAEAYISAPMREYKDVSGDWVVHQDPMPAPPPNQDATPKVWEFKRKKNIDFKTILYRILD